MHASRLSASDRDHLAEVAGGNIRFDEPMSRHTTLKLGGPADAYCSPGDIAALQAVIRYSRERNIPLTAVGGGSNLLVRDGGIRGVVIATRNLRSLRREGDCGVVVQCGVSTGKLLSKTIAWELGGVEFLGGVPGSVGGGLKMNAGTYLGEFVDVTERVTSVRMSDGEEVMRDKQACGFAYRSSLLPNDEVIVEAYLALTPRPATEMKAEVAALRTRRKEREPHGVSNSGSTFKNPEGDYAGRLIEACGLKGTQIGGALCSPVHANWLVNAGDATASELLQLIDLVRDKVKDQHKIELQLEVKVIGDAP